MFFIHSFVVFCDMAPLYLGPVILQLILCFSSDPFPVQIPCCLSGQKLKVHICGSMSGYDHCPMYTTLLPFVHRVHHSVYTRT